MYSWPIPSKNMRNFERFLKLDFIVYHFPLLYVEIYRFYTRATPPRSQSHAQYQDDLDG